MPTIHKTFFFILILILSFACAKPKGTTPQEKRDFILSMEKQTLAELYEKKPATKNLIKNSAGYAVFSNISTAFLIFGTGRGYGVAVDNSNGARIYMRMAEAGVGLGVAITDFREVMIFKDKNKFQDFILKGWDASGQASAAAKYDETGGAVGGEASLQEDIVIYQLTDAGLALRYGLTGTKYWRDGDLN